VPSPARKGRSTAKTVNAGKERPSRWRVLQALGWSHKDAIGFGVLVIATGAILTNVLFLQVGRHPAPMFEGQSYALASASSTKVPTDSKPQTRIAGSAQPTKTDASKADAAKSEPAKAESANTASPAKTSAAANTSAGNTSAAKTSPAKTALAKTPPARPVAEIVADIQRELLHRGFFDGVVDGRNGPRTGSAIRDFERAAGLKPAAASEALLQAIRLSTVAKAGKTTTVGSVSRSTNQPPPRNDPIGAMLAPSKRVLAVQRALAEFGYGQIKPTGIVDADTKAAIEKFERERKLPVTGQASDRVAKELAAITGRAVE
jgi:peptidoglycan hydrolase-like protein with peptidoglycan-binding domain